MFNFKKLISADYLFAIDRVSLHRSDHLILAIGIALVVIAIITFFTARFASNKFSKKFWQRISVWALVIGLLEVLWFGFRVEYIRVFGTHAAAFIVLLIGIAWFIPILKYRLTSFRSDIDSWEKEQVKQKYLNMNK